MMGRDPLGPQASEKFYRVLKSQERVSRRLGAGFRKLRQQGRICKDLKQQGGGSAKALAVGGGSAPEQTRTPYLYPAILPRSQEKQMEA